MSPRTKMLALALFIAILLNFLLYLRDTQLNFGFGCFSFVIITTVLLYALFTRITEKTEKSWM